MVDFGRDCPVLGINDRREAPLYPFQTTELSRYTVLSPAMGRGIHATARVHHAYWRRNGFVAARSARAANETGDRNPRQRRRGCKLKQDADVHA